MIMNVCTHMFYDIGIGINAAGKMYVTYEDQQTGMQVFSLLDLDFQPQVETESLTLF